MVYSRDKDDTLSQLAIARSNRLDLPALRRLVEEFPSSPIGQRSAKRAVETEKTFFFHAGNGALEKAFDYRGDVTLTLKDNSKIEGYVFDRVVGNSLSNSFVRVMPRDAIQKLKIAYADIAALSFTGKDTAAGKSWEAWVRKYWERKASGEGVLSLEPESLE